MPRRSQSVNLNKVRDRLYKIALHSGDHKIVVAASRVLLNDPGVAVVQNRTQTPLEELAQALAPGPAPKPVSDKVADSNEVPASDEGRSDLLLDISLEEEETGKQELIDQLKQAPASPAIN